MEYRWTKRDFAEFEAGMTATFGPADFESWWLAGMTRSDRLSTDDKEELYENCLYLAEAEHRGNRHVR